MCVACINFATAMSPIEYKLLLKHSSSFYSTQIISKKAINNISAINSLYINKSKVILRHKFSKVINRSFKDSFETSKLFTAAISLYYYTILSKRD